MTDTKLKESINQAKENLATKHIELIVKDLKIQDWDENSLSGCCPFHKEDSGSFKWHTKTSSFHCFGCNKNYDIINHYISHTGMSSHKAIETLLSDAQIEYIPEKKKPETNINKKYSYPSRIAKDRTEVEKYMESRGISKATLDFFDVTSNNYGNVLFNYYDQWDVLTFIKARVSKNVEKGENKIIGIIPKEDKKNPNSMGAGEKPVLYGMHKVNPTDTLYLVEGECFPPHVEILTEIGWMRFDEYDPKYKVMSVDKELNGKLVKPNAIIKKKYDGEIWKIKNRNYTSITTPDHNIVYIKDGLVNKKPLSEMNSNDSRITIPTSIRHEGKGINLSFPQIALTIAVSADGTLDKQKFGYGVRIAFKKERKIERFRNILIQNDIKFSESIHASGLSYFGFHAPEWLDSKIFKMEWLSQMSQEQKDFFISEILYWDGNSVPDRNQIEYASKEYSNATFIQTLSHLCGYKSTIIRRENQFGKWFKVSILFGKNSISWQNIDNCLTKYNHEGYVYCVNVPSGMILVRQEENISVSGNCEVLSMHEAGFSNVVSVPFGANNFHWIEYNYEWLSQFPHVVIWMDNDEAGIKARREIIIRLGNHRCRFIDVPQEIILEDGTSVKVKDQNDILVKLGKDKLIELSKYEKDLPIEGVADLFDAEDFNPEEWDGLKTGIEEIDNEIIYKFFFGSIVTVTGTPGSGKSTGVNQFFINEAINSGYGVTVFSGEMPAPVLKNWVSVGLAGREHVRFKPGKGLEKFIRLIDPEVKEKIKNWSYGKIHVIKDDDNSLTEILKRAEQTVKVNGDKVIILDNLATIGLGENGDSNTFQKQKEMMNTLKAFAFRYNVLIVLVVHPRKPSSGNSAEGVGGLEMSGASELYNLCHYNLSFRRYTNDDKKGERSARGDGWKKKPVKFDAKIKFFKNRLMGVTGEIDLYFDALSYRFYLKPAQLWKRMGWDKDNKSPLPNHDPNTHGQDDDEAFEE